VKSILPALISACFKDQNLAGGSLVWKMDWEITPALGKMCGWGNTHPLPCCALHPSDRPYADVSCLIPGELILVGSGHEQRIRVQPRDQATPAELLSSLTSWKNTRSASEGALSLGLRGPWAQHASAILAQR